MTTQEQLARIGAAMKGAQAMAPRQAADLAGAPEAIAIIGLAGSFPGCQSVAEFWQALERDRCLLEEIPPVRFDWRTMYDPRGNDPAKSRSKWGGFIPDIRSFDPAFFGLSAGEAGRMDPRERLLLMAVYHALEDAGYAPGSLRKTRTGVFVAGEESDYYALARERQGGLGAGVDDASNQIASRISHFFDFHGPSEYINALCAGGAVALNRAVQSLRSGEVTSAVVGAVNIILRPDPFLQLSGLELLSPAREVHSFGQHARGYHRAEGVAGVLLKRLSQAEADGDRIYAVIRNTAVSHNGRGGASRTSPDPIAQAELIRACGEQARLDPRRLGYIEAQGMGQPMSDIAEWNAFNMALKAMAKKQGVALEPGKCLVGCLKPTLGHMEAAASLGALFKIIYSLRTRTIYGIHGFTEANPELDLAGQPCGLAAQTQPWPETGLARVAALHAYGMGGNNAHVLVEEYVPRPVPVRSGAGPSLVVLSAPTEAQRAQIARNLRPWIEAHPETNLSDLAYTLQVGRDAMEYRLAVAATTLDELRRALASLDSHPLDSLCQGRAGRVEGVLPPLNELMALGRFWVAGGAVPWSELYRGEARHRLSLPGYPFEKRDCWLDSASEPQPVPEPGANLARQIQARLAALLGEEMGLAAAAIDPEKNFLEYGVGSLAGLRLAQRLGRAFGAPVGLRDWLENASVAAFSRFLARKVEVQAKGESDARSGNAGPESKPREFPLSECQRGLWALHKMRPDSAAYNVPICVRVGVRIESAPWRQACQALLERHPLLGCSLGERNGELLHWPANAPIPVEELELSPADQANLGECLRTRLSIPFVLEQGPLVRIHLLHGSPRETIVLLVAHHLVLDGLSTTPVMAALLDAYLAFKAGKRCERPAREVDFADFVAWERAQLAGESGPRLEAYWKRQLADAAPALRLTAERPAPAGKGGEGKVVTQAVPREWVDRLKAFGRARHLSLPTLFLGVWKVLLHRYSGEDDITVGVVTQVRPDDRFDSLAGYFINLLPIRTRQLGERSFADLAQTLQGVLAEGIDHAAYPFPRMARVLGRISEDDSNPIAQVGYEFQSYLPSLDLERQYGASLSLRQLEDPRQAGELELVLEVVELAETVDVHFKYDTAVYAEGTVRRLAGHFLNLVQGAMAAPTQLPGRIPMLGAEETARLLSGWNATRREYPRERGVHELFQRQARETPDALAVGCEAREITYRELDGRSEALASCLQQWGVKPGEPVALYVDRSPDMVVALLGILKAGAAYLPLDAACPAERLAFMVQDSGAQLLLTQSALKSGLDFWHHSAANGGAGKIVELDRQWAEIEQMGETRPVEPRAVPGGMAYLIYTSGTTGKPKGVMIPHRALTNFLVALEKEPGLGPKDRLLAVTNLGFDIAGLEIFLPLIRGAQCWLCPAASVGDAERLRAVIHQARPTVMQATPSTWKMLFHAGWRNTERVRILCGGEALPEELARSFIAGGMEAWNLYGPTETTIWSTLQRIAGEASVGIGRPIANTRVYILDRQGQPVPVGVAGELFIAGDGLALGYWNRPELTAAKFVPLPFLPGERAYQTGDLACWREDGSIKCLGRADHQVKLRGHRIELEEIESRLNLVPGIRDSAVVVREHQGVKQLVAYYVPTNRNGQAGRFAVDGLASSLRGFLPDYMIPAFFIPLEELPLTPNGKKDRRTLMARRVEAPNSGEQAPPATKLEAAVLAVWREVLGVAKVGATDAFFNAGGDSVMAVMLAERIHRAFGVPFTTTDLFRHSTARAMAAHLAALKVGLQESGIPGADAEHSKSEAQPAPAGGPEYYRDSLAIIGISCHFPGAETPQKFWANLKAGKHSAVFLSPEELRAAGVPDTLARHPAFVPVQLSIPDKDCFDPDFFKLTARSAALMDPQFRLLLMHSWKAVEDAGYVPADLADAGVFMAVSNTFYAARGAEPRNPLNEGENYAAWLLAQEGTVATTISYQLGLHGPSYAVHANCSSSLVALHSAFQTLRQGESRCALVGAASLAPDGKIGYLFQEGLNLSSDGRCKTFDAAADGMVGGEGVAVLVVKRADLAIRDGDHVYAIIRGVGVNNDGSDKAGFYAPGLAGQAEVIEQVLQATGIDPDSIGYVEAHGTGTKLGDPVEVAALSQAYGRHTARKQYCGLGSVKSNIGHLDTAAGLAGCIKAALSLKHRQIPPTLHYHAPNPAIDFANSPFYVAANLREWECATGPRRAGLSCLGIGGTNTHAILEECVASVPALPAADGLALIVLSARNGERLRNKVEDLLHFVTEPEEPFRLADLAFTLQVGRVPMAHRLALVAGTVEQLAEQLRAYLAGGQTVEGRWEGIVPEDGTPLEESPGNEAPRGSIEQWVAERNLTSLARAWVRGAAIEWQALYATPAPCRISLPTYPFARERYHLAETRPAPATTGGTPDAIWLHPLVQENISTLHDQRYRSAFTGQEFFLADHVVQGKRILPGVAYLEMARAAITLATGTPETWDLKHVAWPRPFEVNGQPRGLQIGLRAGEEGEVRFEISAAGETAAGLLCQGVAARRKADDADRPVEAAFSREKYPVRYEGRECYAAFQKLGIDYGPSLQAIVELFTGSEGVLAKLALPGPVASKWDRFALHPSLLDAAVHASIGFYLQDLKTTGQPGPLLLPFALQELEMPGQCGPEMWARLTRRAAPGANENTETLDIELCDPAGRAQVRLKGLFSRQAAGAELASGKREGEVWRAHPVWVGARAEGASPAAFEERQAVVCGLALRGGLSQAELEGSHWVELQSAQECPAARFTEIAELLFRKLQTVLAGKPRHAVLFQVVVPAAREASGLQGLAGLLRTASLENPGIYTQLIAVEDGLSQSELAAILVENSRCLDAPHIRYRQGAREVLRWQDAPVAESGSPLPWRDGGIYLITGGAGGLGLIFAAEIGRRVENATVVLAGRSEPASELRERLQRVGGRCEYRRCDVRQAAEATALIAQIRAEMGPLNGVLHAAGILCDDFILRKPPADFQRVLAPKVAGAINLDRALGSAELDFFTVFSSVAGAFGSVGQSDYATANAFLDEFAEHRQALVLSGHRQGRTLSVNWPLWRDGGMRLDPALQKEMAERTGFVPLDTAEGIQAFYAAMASATPRVAVLSGQRERIQAYLDGLGKPRLAPAVSAASAPVDSAPLASFALEWLRRELATALERPAHRLKDLEKFERYGVDSILAVELTNRLESAFGSLPKTLFFEYQNLKEMAGYFLASHAEKLRQLAGADTPPPTPETLPPAVASNPTPVTIPAMAPVALAINDPSPVAFGSAQPGDIAIIGLSGRYPQAADLAQFWRNLEAGQDAITEVPRERWDWREHYTGDPKRPGDHASKWGGFIEGVDRFDPLFFNISPREADLVDPQERLFLETVWNLFESAGYTREKMRERHQGRVAVYVGAMYQQYHAISSDPVSEAVVSLSSFSGIANRVSYFFDFQGPSVAVDTMCSSSLVAIQMACDCLRSGQVAMAVAGAVNLSIHPYKYTGLTTSKLMGSRADSRSFADGDGYLPSEGVGAVLLKTLAQAVRDGDPILAVIKAATTNHSGQSGGFGVPNPQAQARAAEDCLRLSGIDPATVSYLEASANGSPLGDAIEVKALANALKKFVPERGVIPMGAVKSNIGHSEAASGMAQLSKVVLQLRHGRLAPTLKPARGNPNILFPETPFYLQVEAAEWRRPVLAGGAEKPICPRRALISSVGAGGSTGHLVLEEYPAAPVTDREVPTGGLWLVVLSARNRNRLEAQVKNLREFLQNAPATPLRDVAYTLQLGREAMEHRAALVVSSLAELVQSLEELSEQIARGAALSLKVPAFLGNTEEGDPAFRGIFSGPVGEGILRELLAHKELEKLAAYWVQGGEIRWEKLYEGQTPRIVNLPTYPFERRLCWLRPEGPAATAPAAESPIRENTPAVADELVDFLKTEVSELLRLERAEIPATKALNALGFSSIDAVSLKSKLEQAYAVEIPIAALNAYQSIHQIETELRPLLAQAKSSSAGKPGGAGVPASMQPVWVPALAERFLPFPQSDIQESFYLGRKLGEQARAGSHIYFEIERPELDVYRLNEAWNRLVRRHEMLRAVMLPDGTQRILEETAPYRFRTTDLRRRGNRETAETLARIRGEMARRVYDPEQWPLFEIRVSILADRRIIHFSIDELIVDASSIELLFQQWNQWYEQPASELPPLELSFRDYVLAAKSFAESPRSKKDLEYWFGKLRQMPAGPSLPGFGQAPRANFKPEPHARRREAVLSAPQWAELKRRAESLQASPTALVLGLFVEALRAHCREKAFSLILTFFNRLPIHPQVNQILGPFISTSLFTVAESAPENLAQRVRQTQRQLWEDLDHHSVSGIRVLRELKRRREIAGTLALPVVFTSMLGSRAGDQASLLQDLSYSETQTPQVCLDHQLYEQDGELRFSWDVAPEHFAPGAIDSLFRHYCQLLATAATVPDFWENAQWPAQLPPTETLPEPPIEAHPEDHAQPFPLTDQQQAYAFGRSGHGSQTPSNVYLEFETGELDVARLELAWNRVIAAHPMLAATIRPDGTQQVLAQVPAYSIIQQDFSQLAEDKLQAALDQIEREMAARLCPLGEWPFFELRATRWPAGKMRVHLCVDMIIADPASIDVIAQELFAAYAHPAKAPAPPALAFQDYLNHIRKLRENGGGKLAEEYWKQKFANIPPGPALPYSGAEATGKTYRLAAMFDGWAGLKNKANELKVNPSMILLAAFVEALWKPLGEQPFSLVIPGWQRPPWHPEIYRVVGDFTTMAWLPVRNLEGSFRERVVRYQAEVRADLAHSAVSGLKALRKLILKMKPEPRNRYQFPVVFTDLSPQPDFALPAGIRFTRSSSQTASVAIDNVSTEHGDQLELHWDVAEGVFAAGWVEGVFADYGRILRGLIASESSWEEARPAALINMPNSRLEKSLPIPLRADKVTGSRL